MHGLGAVPLDREDGKLAAALKSLVAHTLALVGTTTSGATPTALWTSAYACGGSQTTRGEFRIHLHGRFCRVLQQRAVRSSEDSSGLHV